MTDASVLDVAEYVLKKHGAMSAMKLQKLVYYSQAWSLVWDERPLFGEKIKAWENGPVCPALYAKHRGRFSVSCGLLSGDPSSLDTDAKLTVKAVLGFYGDKSAQWLSDLTHAEAPWKNARARGKNEEITRDAMRSYYSSL
jgi:uncharacterized phage-associated protein